MAQEADAPQGRRARAIMSIRRENITIHHEAYRSEDTMDLKNLIGQWVHIEELGVLQVTDFLYDPPRAELTQLDGRATRYMPSEDLLQPRTRFFTSAKAAKAADFDSNIKLLAEIAAARAEAEKYKAAYEGTREAQGVALATEQL